MKVLAGAGALVSTAGDMLTFLEYQIGIRNTDLAPAISETQRPRRSAGSPEVIVNNTLRAGLGLRDKPSRKAEKIALRTFCSRLKAGIDESKLNQLADHLEVESFRAETLKPLARIGFIRARATIPCSDLC